MGLVHPGVPKELTLAIKRLVGAQAFVETGTAGGDSAAWAAQQFERVVSIELDPALHRMAADRLRRHANVELRLGASEAVLPSVLAELPAPAIVWLDAHWSGPGSGGEAKECPVLEEIAAVDAAGTDHVIMIDDARLFLNVPGAPLHAEHWPSFEQISATLRRRAERSYLLVHDDVIFRIPQQFRGPVELYLLGLNTPSLLRRAFGRGRALLRRLLPAKTN